MYVTVILMLQTLLKRTREKSSRARKRWPLYLNFLRECGTKHKCLSIASFWHCILFHNPSDLRFKSHIQHTICLVQHQKPADERLSDKLQLRMRRISYSNIDERPEVSITAKLVIKCEKYNVTEFVKFVYFYLLYHA